MCSQLASLCMSGRCSVVGGMVVGKNVGGEGILNAWWVAGIALIGIWDVDEVDVGLN